MIARMRSFLYKTWCIVRWPLGAFVFLYLALFIYELIQYPQRSRDTVAAIHAQKLTMADVDGSNLPPPPDPNLVDATVEGIDANENGIRDDVELAIFERYPNDIKTRAAALQYARTIQNYLTQVFNTETLTAAAQQEERASSCISETMTISPEESAYIPVQAVKRFVKEGVINTAIRQEKANENTKLISSFGSLPAPYCDVDL